MSLSNVSLVAFHYRSYGTFCIYSKKLHNLYSGFTHYRNYRAKKTRILVFMIRILFFYVHTFSKDNIILYKIFMSEVAY